MGLMSEITRIQSLVNRLRMRLIALGVTTKSSASFGQCVVDLEKYGSGSTGIYTGISGDCEVQAQRILDLRKRLAARCVALAVNGVTASSNLETCVAALEKHSFRSSSYSVATASGASYGFNKSGEYYVSANKGVSNSAAVCVLTIAVKGSWTASLDCISYGESNYDYGIIGAKNATLSTSNTADSSNVLKSFKGLSSASVQNVSLGTLKDETAKFYIKYRKDGSVNSGNDTLQFKVNLT